MSNANPLAGGRATPEERKAPESIVRAVFPGAEMRDDGDGGPPVLHGHFAVFDQWTEIASFWEGNFMERIAPGAFKKTMAENRSKIRVLLNHGQDPVLGDKPIGAPETLEEDAQGARYEVPLFRGVPDLVMDGLRAGQYGASFRFKVLREEIVEEPKASAANPKGLPERTIKEVQLHEFGPVTFPAYEGATAGVRSLTDRFMPVDAAVTAAVDAYPDHAPSEPDAEAQPHLEQERREPGPAAPVTETTQRTPITTWPPVSREEFAQWTPRT